MAEKIEKSTPEKENKIELLSEHIRKFVFPKFKELQQKLQTFDDEIKEKIKAGERITQKDLDRFDKIALEIEGGIHKALSHKQDPLLHKILRLRVHNVKNVLFGNILGYANLDDSYRKVLEAYVTIGKGSERFKINNTDLAEFETVTKKKIEPKVSNIAEIREIFEDEAWPERKKVILVYHPSQIDQNKLSVSHVPIVTRDCFQELIKNAVDAMPDGGKLEFKIDKRENDVVITISDTGKGISSENLKKIFEKGFTTKAKGTGMGLPLVKSYFKDILGGKFEIDSEEGKGTTITITLPLIKEK